MPKSDVSEIHFTFDGRRLGARKGETIAFALYRNGIKVLTRSMKFHRPRGLYCGTGECPNCLMNVNGVPNVRTCVTGISEGMVVESQNRILSLKMDPVAVMDHIYRKGFNYHHKFIRPAFAKGLYQQAIRRMAGIGEVPNGDMVALPTRRLDADVLVIGGDATALDALDLCVSAGVKTVSVRQQEHLVTPVQVDGMLERTRDLAILKDAMAIGAFDDGSVAATEERRLNIIRPRFIVLAEKEREQPMFFDNWDMPGILQETAARKMLEHRGKIGERVVVTGETERSAAIAHRLHGAGTGIAAIVVPDSIDSPDDWMLNIAESGWKAIRADGRTVVRNLIISNGKNHEKIACDAVVTCGSMIPRVDIARQLGCTIESGKKAPPRIAVNESFETTRKDVFAIGGSAGLPDRMVGIDSAETAVRAILARMKG